MLWSPTDVSPDVRTSQKRLRNSIGVSSQVRTSRNMLWSPIGVSSKVRTSRNMLWSPIGVSPGYKHPVTCCGALQKFPL
jgi:hypothetical protein